MTSHHDKHETKHAVSRVNAKAVALISMSSSRRSTALALPSHRRHKQDPAGVLTTTTTTSTAGRRRGKHPRHEQRRAVSRMPEQELPGRLRELIDVQRTGLGILRHNNRLRYLTAVFEVPSIQALTALFENRGTADATAAAQPERKMAAVTSSMVSASSEASLMTAAATPALVTTASTATTAPSRLLDMMLTAAWPKKASHLSLSAPSGQQQQPSTSSQPQPQPQPQAQAQQQPQPECITVRYGCHEHVYTCSEQLAQQAADGALLLHARNHYEDIASLHKKELSYLRGALQARVRDSFNRRRRHGLGARLRARADWIAMTQLTVEQSQHQRQPRSGRGGHKSGQLVLSVEPLYQVFVGGVIKAMRQVKARRDEIKALELQTSQHQQQQQMLHSMDSSSPSQKRSGSSTGSITCFVLVCVRSADPSKSVHAFLQPPQQSQQSAQFEPRERAEESASGTALCFVQVESVQPQHEIADVKRQVGAFLRAHKLEAVDSGVGNEAAAERLPLTWNKIELRNGQTVEHYLLPDQAVLCADAPARAMRLAAAVGNRHRRGVLGLLERQYCDRLAVNIADRAERQTQRSVARVQQLSEQQGMRNALDMGWQAVTRYISECLHKHLASMHADMSRATKAQLKAQRGARHTTSASASSPGEHKRAPEIKMDSTSKQEAVSSSLGPEDQIADRIAALDSTVTYLASQHRAYVREYFKSRKCTLESHKPESRQLASHGGMFLAISVGPRTSSSGSSSSASSSSAAASSPSSAPASADKAK